MRHWPFTIRKSYSRSKKLAGYVIRIDELELALLEWLRNYVDKYELTDALPEDAENVAAKEAIVKNFEKEHETLLKQRESLFDFLEQGIYTKEIFIERSNALEQRVKECMEHIISAQNDLHATLALQANRKNFVPRCKNLLGLFCLRFKEIRRFYGFSPAFR